jgi:putative ABC transport system ATP-binding protein
MPTALSLSRVSKIFNPNTIAPIKALNDISLDIEAGEHICIIGANGSGKSTLLRVIAGAHEISEGAIYLNGHDITRWSEHRRSRRVALVDQIPGARMAPALTIEQNLALSLMRTRRPLWQIAVREKEREQFRQVLSPLGLGLESRLDSKVRELSGGQAQALTVVALTRLFTPEILLLDEHCASLDPRMSSLVMETTAKLCQDLRITTVMVTHDFEHAALYGNRLILMAEGKPVVDLRSNEKRGLTARNIFDLFMQHQSSHYQLEVM